MDRPCDCSKCFKTHGTNGPIVTFTTIKKHRKSFGLRKIDPQQLSVSSPPPESVSQTSPDQLQDVVSKAHEEIIKTSLQSYGNLGNISSGPHDLQTPRRTDGNWLFLSVALVTYLHVVAGVSRRVVNSTLRILRLILIQFSQKFVLHQFDQELLDTFPKDCSTAMKWLEIESELKRSVCCPKCFKKYRNPTADEPPIPQRCTRKETEPSDNNHSLDYQTWTLRSHADHTRQANAWKDARTHNARKAVFDTCGVRWSCLNELQYWDPTKMVVVDTMHCISGILEYHFRRVWNLDELGKTLDNEKEDSKLVDLLQEAIDTNMEDTWVPFQTDLDLAMGFSNDTTSNDITSSSSTRFARPVGSLLLTPCTLTALEELPLDDELDNIYDDDGDMLTRREDLKIQHNLLSGDALQRIRSAIVSTSMPSWMCPPPSNLGSASHGKLRSSDWVVLVTVHLTFVIFQLNDLGMITPEVATNALHLCSLTEIVMSYQSSMAKIENYFNHLTAYRSTLQKLRPDLKPTPNQHMAFHVPFQHYNYGPSAYLAAWQFEQYNGILQKIPNNRKIWELDLTMIRQVCRASNLAVALDSPDLPECVREVSPLMQCGKKLSSAIGEIPLINDTTPSTSSILQDMPDNLCSVTYDALLRKLKLSNPSIRHQFDQSSQGSFISSRVGYVKQIPWSGRSLTTRDTSCKNSIIEYSTLTPETPALPAFGQILKIFHHTRQCEKTGRNKQETFLSVLRFSPLYECDTPRDPFKNWPDLNVRLFYNPSNAQVTRDLGSHPELVPEVIQLHEVSYFTASFTYKSGSFGIQHPTIAIKSLSRGRHTWS
ncbi:hypothetical protein DFH28DRAFT_894310 [Melampsora americana]|nr:hypothetical protein DFH28DRAFT_894310 [Melampsora americana]